jgi:hypothetical protein
MYVVLRILSDMGIFLVLWIGKEELRIILCLADGDVTSDTLNIPNDVVDIVERHSLVPFLGQVGELCWSFCLHCIDGVKLVAMGVLHVYDNSMDGFNDRAALNTCHILY